MIDDEVTILDILATAGQEEYSAMREQYMRTGEGFLCVYESDSKNSFEDVALFHRQILRVKDRESFPVIIVGLKQSDCLVTPQQGADLVSVMETDSVDEAFYELVREIRRFEKEALFQKLKQKKAKSKCSLQ